MPPYDEIVLAVRAGKSDTYLVDKFAAPIRAAKAAAQSMNGAVVDWAELVAIAHRRHATGEKLKSAGETLMQGDDINAVELLSAVGHLNDDLDLVTSADKVTPEIIHYKPIFWPPIDKEIGGVPHSGMVLIAAMPKTGKTSLLAQLSKNAAHQKKYTLIFSLEQRKSEFVGRLLEIGTPKKDLKYILIVDALLDIDAIAALTAKVAADYDLYFVGADFADPIASRKGQIDEANMTYVYAAGADIAKINGFPFFLLAQFNDGAYRAGIPHVEHIRYSRMAVAYASQIWLAHNPNMIWTTTTEDSRLPIFPGQAYIIVGISRHGFGEHDAVGAVRADWEPKTGWGDADHGWHGLGGIY